MTTYTTMSSMQRVLTTLGHQEPDRVPLFLLPTLHGARELGLSIKKYFSKSEYVVEGQQRMIARYKHDCYSPFFYGPIEVEAFGGEVIFYEDGPPNSGEPVIRKTSDISTLKVPDIEHTDCLLKVLETIRLLKKKSGDEVPIIGVVMSPFSIPVMQMGFPSYIQLMYESPKMFDRLMAVNMEFCILWANLQLQAGATAICYFDPLASPGMVTREMYLKTGFQVAKQTISQINGPTATHLASGSCLNIIDDLVATGTGAVGVSSFENLAEVKAACRDKITVIGNLNGIEMRRWTQEQAEDIVKSAIGEGAGGGGFILSDNHGEIPWQVSEDVLLAISAAVREHGRYPILCKK